jgi:predicted transcriptional regulator
MKRTTVRLEDGLLAEAKKKAAESHRTLTAVIEDALRESLSRQRRTGGKRRVRLPAAGRGGLQPGVDLDNTAALLDLMDGR